MLIAKLYLQLYMAQKLPVCHVLVVLEVSQVFFWFLTTIRYSHCYVSFLLHIENLFLVWLSVFRQKLLQVNRKQHSSI